MADFADGYRVTRELARNDWYGITVREMAERLGWEYQKTHRVLRDVAEAGVCRCGENGAWRLSENFLELLTRAQASYLDRLNLLVRPEPPKPFIAAVNESAGAAGDAEGGEEILYCTGGYIGAPRTGT